MNKNKIFVYFADMVTMDIDVYDVLKVGDKHMDVSDLKQICQKQIKLLHPDKNGGQESEEFLKSIKATFMCPFLICPPGYEMIYGKTNQT